MPRREQKKTGADEKPESKKLKSGVEVWYPTSLYPGAGAKTTPSTSADNGSSALDLAPRPSSSTKPNPIQALHKEIDVKRQHLQKKSKPRTVGTLAKGDSVATQGTKTLKSGVAVWYPEALYPTTDGVKGIEQSSASNRDISVPKRVSLNIRKRGVEGIIEGPAADRLSTGDDESEGESPKRKPGVTKPKDIVKQRKMTGLKDDVRISVPTGTTGTLSQVVKPKKSRKVISKKLSTRKETTITEEKVDDIVTEDVEMAEITPVETEDGTSESMEIDMVETVKQMRDTQNYLPSQIPNIPVPSIPTINSVSNQPVFCFVFDTNVFLNEKAGNFLVALAQNRLPQLPVVQIRIPHIVFVELDRLKMRTGNPVSLFAIQAIRFLNDRISEHKDPRFIGQTASEYSQGITDFPPLMNDDRILVYYLQIKAQRNPHYRVVCVTNDVNLQTRGAVNNIDIISGAKLFDEVGKRMRGEVSMFDEPVGSRIVEPPVTMLNFPSSVCLQLQNCIKIILVKLLSTLVESRMKEHPGGPEIILEYAGSDATSVFFDKGHSDLATRILEKHFIGELTAVTESLFFKRMCENNT